MIGFEQFLKKVDDCFLATTQLGNQWRYGQTIMNILWEVWPEKHKEIMNSDIDCFYNNSTIADVLDKLEKEWPT